jgi:23S rRNA (uridine2479-2'-O)-methyltransferase
VRRELQVTARNARFQQWEALLTNRAKRHRLGEFLVQGVRPITMAIRHGWPVRALLYDATRDPSGWASELLANVDTTRVAMAGPLLHELGGKEDDTPELIAVVAFADDDLDRIPTEGDPLVVVFDRPGNPGNLGTLIRSADAFGAAGVIVTGHAADIYDPKAVRASTGSLFALPVIRSPSSQPVLDWLEVAQHHGTAFTVVGTDEHGEIEITEQSLTGPTVLLVGNEAAGLAASWRRACDAIVHIPITGTASSLNAAAAAAIALYEANRQRRHRRRPPS